MWLDSRQKVILNAVKDLRTVGEYHGRRCVKSRFLDFTRAWKVCGKYLALPGKEPEFKHEKGSFEGYLSFVAGLKV
jgi:hypothetical protein